MPIAESILPEFDHETATTRTLLERVPPDKAEWKPHVKSMSLGQLAMHIANLPQWASFTLERTEFDTNPPDGPRITTPAFQSASQLLQSYDAGVSAARGIHGAVDAEERRQENVQHAARGGLPVVRSEPRGASPRTAQRLSAPARRAGPEHLRTDGGHAIVGVGLLAGPKAYSPKPVISLLRETSPQNPRSPAVRRVFA